jgi:hypothetical protein
MQEKASAAASGREAGKRLAGMRQLTCIYRVTDGKGARVGKANDVT